MPEVSRREGGESCQEDQELKQGSDRSRSEFASDPLSSLRQEGMIEGKGRGQPKERAWRGGTQKYRIDSRIDQNRVRERISGRKVH